MASSNSPNPAPTIAGAPTIDGLEVLAELGAGAGSVVYRARRGGREYALKLQRLVGDDDIDAARAFRREAAILSQLRHPGLVQIHAVGESDGRPYLIMELLLGRTLAATLADATEPLAERRIVALARDCVGALAAAHRAGLVHRDVKPENIIITEDGHAKLIDFGLATRSGVQQGKDVAVGTLLYSPPEQTGMLKRPVDGRSDLYALGVVLFEAASGAPPFRANDVGELVRLQAVAAPPDLRRLAPGLSPALVGIIERLLAKDPDDRYQTGQGLLADLDRLAAHDADNPADFSLARDDNPASVEYDLPLVGRRAELDELRVRWQETVRGRGGVALVEGAPGQGKSRLVRELLAGVRPGGALVLSAKIVRGNPVPLACLREAVEAHLVRVGRLAAGPRADAAERARRAAIDAAGMAAAFSPLLGELVGETAVGTADGERQEQYYAAVATFLAGLAREHGRALLWIDDVQWLDEASRRVLEILALELHETPLLVVASSRNDADSAAGHDRFVARMGDSVGTRIAVGPLDEASTAALVNEQLGGVLADDGFARQIHVRSAGNPFAAVEYVRAVLHAGLISASWGVVRVDQAGLEEIALPDDVLDLILARVSDLGDDARRLLTAGAAMGSRFRPATLGDVLDFDDSRVSCAVGDALRERLIERVDGDECAYVHDRIREALLDPLGPEQLRALHQRIAERLEARGGDSPDDVFAIARHYALGEHTKAPDKLYAWSVRAGEAALAGFAANEGVEFFARADEVARAAGINHTGEFFETWGALHLGRGDLDGGREKLALALEHSDDVLQRAGINRLLARAEASGYNAKDARRYALAGLHELGQEPPTGGWAMLVGTLVATTRCLLTIAGRRRPHKLSDGDRARLSAEVRLYQEVEYAAYMEMRSFAVMSTVMRTLSRSLRLGPSVELSHTLVGVSVIAASIGSRRLRDRLLRRGLAMAEEIGDPQAVAHARLMELLGLEAIGDTRAAGVLAERLLPEHGRWLDIQDLLAAVSAVAFNLGLRGHGLKARDEWVAVHERMRNVQAAGVAENPYLCLGIVVLEGQGERAEAAELFAACKRNADNADPENRFLRQSFLATQMSYLVDQGDLGPTMDEAFRQCDALELNPHTVSFWAVPNFMQPAIVLAERAVRSEGDARATAVAQARARLRKLRFTRFQPLWRGFITSTDATLCGLEGKPKRALALADKVERWAIQCDAPMLHYEVARIRAREYGQLGDAAESTRQAKIALRLALDMPAANRAQWIADEFGVSLAGATSGTLTTTGRRTTGGRASTATRVGGNSGTRHGASIQGKRSLDALLALSLAAAQTRDQHELAAVALDQLVALLGAERAFLFLADDDTSPLMLSAARGADGAELTETTGYAQTVVDRVREERAAQVVTGTEEGAALGSESAVQHGLRSILAAPLMLEGRLLGVVYLDSRLARGIFTADDVEILAAISNHIAISLETARAAHLETTVAAEREQRALAETLRDSMAVISTTLEPAAVVSSLLEMAGRSIAYDRAAVLMLEGRTWSLAAVAGDLAPELPEAHELAPGVDPRTELIASDGAGRVVSDVAGGAAPLPDLLGDAGAWLAVPLAARGELAGVLVMATDERDGLGPAQLELAATFAGQGIVAYENARLFAAMQLMAITDELTKVSNRRHFFEQGDKLFATAHRYGPPLSVLMLDIDHFKQVNDRYGHAAGDDVIRTVAERLSGVVRTMDLLGRYGGEEFALVLPETDEGAAVLGDRLREAIEAEPITTCEGEIVVTISVGVTIMDDADHDLAAILNRADSALYEAKRAGRNCVRVVPESAAEPEAKAA